LVTIEEWRPVVGYEGYYDVSNQGNIRSVKRVVKCGKQTMTVRESIMHPQVDNSGYLCFSARKDGSFKKVYVHRCVAEAFLNQEDQKDEINHKDGNKTNNCVDNLEWATY